MTAATGTAAAPLLSVRGLRTRFRTRRGMVDAVDGVSFDIAGGEILALLGESGCGKSVTALSVMGLVPARTGEVSGGDIEFDGQAIGPRAAGGAAALRRLRGTDMVMIFQDPMSSLNPVQSVGRQVAEALVCHGRATPAQARRRVIELFGEVGITAPERRFDSYPHELSGGMCQRVMIAMALACDPRLLIADEPTTALDVTTQQQIMDLMQDLCRRRDTAVLLITHDLGVVAENADRAAVMYLGQIVEQAPTAALLAAPAHPYTHGLLAAMPDLDDEAGALHVIPGMVPDLAARPPGCAFAPRCARADARCRATAPGVTMLAPSHSVRCWKPLTRTAP